MIRAIFFGVNPTQLGTDPNEAFAPNTPSGRNVGRWIEALGLRREEDALVFNACTRDTPGNRSPKLEEINYTRVRKYLRIHATVPVIALGKLATIALIRAGATSFFVLPHPSTKNRALNDKDAVEAKIAECRAWLAAKEAARG